jgi:hypothetical protein
MTGADRQAFIPARFDVVDMNESINWMDRTDYDLESTMKCPLSTAVETAAESSQFKLSKGGYIIVSCTELSVR